MYNILIKFPTRGRPDKFFSTLDLYISKAKNLSKIAFLISADVDDVSMTNDEVLTRLNSYRERVKLIYFFSNNKTKIQAVNADLEKVSNWDILLLASDDMIPLMDGYDEIISQDMSNHFKDTDGVLWYHDGAQDRINTLSILGKKYYDRFNYIYHPDYISLWCDNEFTEVSQKLNKVYRSSQVIIEHRHPAWQKSTFDELYVRNESFYSADHITYNKRSQNNFDLNLPILSILTPSIPQRLDSHLKKIINKIDNQIKDLNVEHLVFLDNKKRSIGYKRDALVKMAKGRYLAFVDDDDDVSEDYVYSLVNAAKEGADVITFKQKCLVNDNKPSVINFSLKNTFNEDYIPGSIINRIPFHVCAWKTSLAQKYNFNDSNWGEDWFWIEQLIKEAKTEYHIDRILHTYIYNDKVSAAPRS